MEKERYKSFHRLIKIIQEIKTSPNQTVEELAKKLGVSRSQFYKDRKGLMDIGFEFQYDRSKASFVITKDPYLPIENLSLGERISLMMAVRQLSASGDYILTYEGLNAARKLAADLPHPLRERALSLFDDIVLDEGFGCKREILENLQRAVDEKRRILLIYKQPDKEKPISEEVDLYHIFFQRRSLYAEGYSWTQKGIRMYRLNRMKTIELTGMIFSVHKDYDFSLRHKNAFSAFPGETTEHVMVRFGKRIRPYIEESLWHSSQKITEQANGDILFEVDVAEPREVLWWAFFWGGEAEIITPGWLREEAKKNIKKLYKKYMIQTKE